MITAGNVLIITENIKSHSLMQNSESLYVSRKDSQYCYAGWNLCTNKEVKFIKIRHNVPSCERYNSEFKKLKNSESDSAVINKEERKEWLEFVAKDKLKGLKHSYSIHIICPLVVAKKVSKM